VTKAGALGLFDLVAIGPTDVRCIQVKGGFRRLFTRGGRQLAKRLEACRP